MNLRFNKYAISFFLLIFAVGCVSIEPTPSQDPEPTKTDVPETQTPVSGPSSLLDVPVGEPPVVDGVLSPNEWVNAAHTTMSDDSDLYWVYANDMLYVAVKSLNMGSMNLAIQYEDQVRILHSSAALGSAIYEKRVDGWHLTQDFSWCCRSKINFDEMEQLFQDEGWLATIGYLGTPGEVEFQVVVPDGEVRVAVSYMFSESQVSFWPEDLSQSAVDQLKGIRNDFEDFHLDQWVTLSIPD
jgi:hypothetical protein